MRAYLLTRLEQICRSTTAGLALSSLLFAAYHVYQGAAGVISALVLGLVFGAAFCLWRRIWPLVIAHAAYDFIGLTLLALRR